MFHQNISIPIPPLVINITELWWRKGYVQRNAVQPEESSLLSRLELHEGFGRQKFIVKKTRCKLLRRSKNKSSINVSGFEQNCPIFRRWPVVPWSKLIYGVFLDFFLSFRSKKYNNYTPTMCIELLYNVCHRNCLLKYTRLLMYHITIIAYYLMIFISSNSHQHIILFQIYINE